MYQAFDEQNEQNLKTTLAFAPKLGCSSTIFSITFFLFSIPLKVKVDLGAAK